MADPRIENLARILVDYSAAVNTGEWVLVNAHIEALPLAAEVTRRVLQAGGNPTLLCDCDDINEIIFTESNEEQLSWISPVERLVYEHVDVMVNLRAAQNTRSLAGIPAVKQRTKRQARRELMQTYMRRGAEGSLRWVITQYPCNAYAQEADMSLSDYQDFVYQATFADQPDPVKCWQEIHKSQQRLVDWLKGKHEVVIRSPNSDLTLSIKDRLFINSDGRRNMPSGEIFTGPVETSANGWIRFTYPAIYMGREVNGVELVFKDGKVVQAQAAKNEEFLLAMLDNDEGARYLGEFAFGTNRGIQKFTKSILFDEKIGGSIHLALGEGYPETGSVNHSSIHWDLICDMRDQSEVWIDQELFYQNGEFKVG